MKKFCKTYGLKEPIHGWYWTPIDKDHEPTEILLINPLKLLEFVSKKTSEQIIFDNLSNK